MNVVKNILELKALDKKQLGEVVLGGDLTSCVIVGNDNHVADIDSIFIRQTPLSKSVNTIQAEIDPDAVQYLHDRKIKAVVIAEYAYLRVLAPYIRTKQRYHAYFLSSGSDSAQCHLTRFQFVNGKLHDIKVRRALPDSRFELREDLFHAIESDLTGEWQSSRVLVFDSEHEWLEEEVKATELDIELVKRDLFKTKRFGTKTYAVKELILRKNYNLKSSRKPFLIGAVSLVVMLGAALISGAWMSWKESQLTGLQDRYRVESERQKLAFESSDLVLWSKRHEYLTNINKSPALSYKIERLLMALSSLHPRYNVVVQQVSISREKEFRANGVYYNTKLEVGFERKTNNAEYDVNDALQLLMKSLSGFGDGIDVWDRINIRTFKGKKFNMVTLYANTEQ
ncbi:hypothetical protein [Vibrio rotiferianus]|uniref:hypothetical protein n=1 Tax=Vibrio rotiferianus TaxID=190895 RepID=UPI0005F06A9D|nr:hypothetical protein [Vibrio rotiferianus]